MIAEWSSRLSYDPGSVVAHSGKAWIAAHGTMRAPNAHQDDWSLIEGVDPSSEHHLWALRRALGESHKITLDADGVIWRAKRLTEDAVRQRSAPVAAQQTQAAPQGPPTEVEKRVVEMVTTWEARYPRSPERLQFLTYAAASFKVDQLSAFSSIKSLQAQVAGLERRIEVLAEGLAKATAKSKRGGK